MDTPATHRTHDPTRSSRDYPLAKRDLVGDEKKASLEHRILVFVDESGFYLLPAAIRSYAPCGQTPILRVFQTRDHLSVMSGIAPHGWLFTMTRYDALHGLDSVHFLKHLRSQTDRKL